MVDRTGRTLIVALALGGGVLCPGTAAAQLASASPAVVTRTARVLPGRLDGLVTDHRGAPLPGAAITAQGGSVQFAVSDDHGRFSFYSLEPGPYLVRAVLPGYVTSRRELVQVLPAHAVWQAFRLSRAGAAGTDPAERPVLGASIAGSAGGDAPDRGAIAWRLRHLKRSVLREESPSADEVTGAERIVDAWLAGRELDRLTPAGAASYASVQTGWLPGLPVRGQVQLLTASNFDTPQELFSAATIPAGIAYVALGSPVGRTGHWSAQMAMAQGDLSSWAFAGDYSAEIGAGHAIDVAVAYGLQRYEGANPVALQAVAGGNRYAGAITVSDRWSFSPRASLTVGTRHNRYGYIDGPSMWSPSASLRLMPSGDVAVRVSVSQSMNAPGAEEFVPVAVGGLWLPSHRTFAPVQPDAPFRPSRTRHLEVAVDREIGGFLLSARGFSQHVRDQVVTVFGAQTDDRPRTDLGHYLTANAGDVEAYGWGVELSRPVGSRLRGGVAYSLARAQWRPSPEMWLVARSAPSLWRSDGERLHDVTTTVETEFPQIETRVFALYRLSSGFARPSGAERSPGLAARFDVQVTQPLPFLDFTLAEWEALVAVRNLFREAGDGMSIYDELLVVRPPKRIVGGLLVRF